MVGDFDVAPQTIGDVLGVPVYAFPIADLPADTQYLAHRTGYTLVDRNEILVAVDVGGKFHDTDGTSWRFTKTEDGFLSMKTATDSAQKIVEYVIA